MENKDQAQLASDQPVGGNTPQQPELNISDLQNLRGIVDVAVRRGAFAATELSAVGAVYDRLNSFLNAVAPAASQPEGNTNN